MYKIRKYQIEIQIVQKEKKNETLIQKRKILQNTMIFLRIVRRILEPPYRVLHPIVLNAVTTDGKRRGGGIFNSPVQPEEKHRTHIEFCARRTKPVLLTVHFVALGSFTYFYAVWFEARATSNERRATM